MGVLAVVAAAVLANSALGAGPPTNETFLLAMTIQGCPCNGKLAGAFTSIGAAAERGTVRGVFKAKPTLAKPTLSGTTTLHGSRGAITIAYLGRLIPTSRPKADKSVDYGIGLGTWTVRSATGDFAVLRGRSGKLYVTLAKHVVHASYLPA
jgi:hypothetical protein